MIKFNAKSRIALGQVGLMASVLLGGTTGVALLVILSASEGSGATLDTALVLAVLAPVLTVAFIAARRRPSLRESDRG